MSAGGRNVAKRVFEAEGIAISYDSEVCAHSGNCTRGLATVFNTEARPWIQPQQATPDEVAQQVGQCPSGALQVERMGPASGQ